MSPRASLLLLGLAACASAPPPVAPAPLPPARVVKIRVLDDEGRPLASAAAVRFGADGKVDREVTATRPGEVTMPLEGAPPIVKLAISALDRKSELAFVTTSEASELEVRLGTYAKIPAKVDDVMVLVFEHDGFGGLMDSKPVPGGWSVNPRRGEGTFHFLVADRPGHPILADLWAHADKTERAFVPFDREHLPPAGRPGRVVAQGVSAALTDVLTRIPNATRFGGERTSAAKLEELRAELARTALGAQQAEVKSAAALAYFSVPDPPSTPDAKTIAATALAVPATDVLWSLVGAGYDVSPFGRAAALLDEPFTGARAQAFVNGQADAYVVTDYLQSAMIEARGKPDEQRAILAAAVGPRLAGARMALEDESPDRKTARGKRLPDFEVTTRDGKKVSSRSLAGRPWLLDFWSSSCGPCIRDAKELARIHAAYAKAARAKPLGILSITSDTAEEVAAFQKDHAMPWQHAVLERAQLKTLLSTFELTGAVPTYILVGPDGTILDSSPALDGRALLGALHRELGPE